MRGRAHPATGPRRRPTSGTGLLTAMVAGALVAGVAFTGPALTAATGSAPAGAAPATGPAGVGQAPPGPDDCAPMVAALAPRDRLAQRLMVGVDAADPAGATRIVRDSQVGGVFLGGNETALLQDDRLQALQDVSRTPLAVAVDEEGGRVQRIDELDGDRPSAREMARRSEAEVTELARSRAAQLRARGVTWNLAPSLDVSDQPRSAVVGDRSFSDDPDVVTRYARAWAEGQQAGGVYGVLKHFPGHGSSSGDSHEGSVTVPPLAELAARDLTPYAALVGPGRPLDGRVGVMLGHLEVPGLTREGVPTSVDPAAYRLLREQYRFDGVVMTDDLGAMKAITDRYGLAEATTRALSAGADIALFSNVTAVAPLLDAAERALADGRIPAGANDEATARVLESKGLCSRR